MWLIFLENDVDYFEAATPKVNNLTFINIYDF